MLKKKFIKSRKVAKVTFEIPETELPGDIEIQSIHLVGDFNNWDERASELKYVKRRAYNLTMELDPGVEYQFKYLINGETWYNDWHADRYVRNDQGGDNCCVYAPTG